MNMTEWAAKWQIPPQALTELARLALTAEGPPPPPSGRHESLVQTRVRIEAAQAGIRLWRNNVGALLDMRGIPVRFGLCNDSKEVNARFKSADLIGIQPVVIKPEHVGRLFGLFISRECKRAEWSYTGDPHEVAQKAWADLINSLGGDAKFVTGPGSFSHY